MRIIFKYKMNRKQKPFAKPQRFTFFNFSRARSNSFSLFSSVEPLRDSLAVLSYNTYMRWKISLYSHVVVVVSLEITKSRAEGKARIFSPAPYIFRKFTNIFTPFFFQNNGWTSFFGSTCARKFQDILICCLKYICVVIVLQISMNICCNFFFFFLRNQ